MIVFGSASFVEDHSECSVINLDVNNSYTAIVINTSATQLSGGFGSQRINRD